PLTMRARVVYGRYAIGHCSVRYGRPKAPPQGEGFGAPNCDFLVCWVKPIGIFSFLSFMKYP
ncbi:MAG: hypothetical protein PUD80_09205, partial [Firmicutes bacterium]|nr:hypothetical protein [Bacillota bacterium]